jgi:hypothetical protein
MLPRVPPPSKAIADILKQLDGDVATWVTSRDEDARETARLRIRNANARIKKENMASGLAAPTYTLRKDDTTSVIYDFNRMKAKLRSGAVHLAQGLGQAIIINFDALRKRPENQWPVNWVDAVSAAVADAHTREGHVFSDPRQVKPRANPFFGGSARQQSHHTDADEDTVMFDAPLARHEAHPKQLGLRAGQLSRPLRPGYTLDGRRILGYRGWFSTDIRDQAHGKESLDPDEACLTKMQFIVQGPDQKTIQLLPGAHAGKLVKSAYFRMPLDQQCFVPNSMNEAKGSIPTPTRILAYACYDSSSSVPDGVALCEAETGPPFLISLTVMRQMLGKDQVDADIRRFLGMHKTPATKLLEGNRRPRLNLHADGLSASEGSDSDFEEMKWPEPRRVRGRKAARPGDDRSIRSLVGDFGRRLRI